MSMLDLRIFARGVHWSCHLWLLRMLSLLYTDCFKNENFEQIKNSQSGYAAVLYAQLWADCRGRPWLNYPYGQASRLGLRNCFMLKTTTALCVCVCVVRFSQQNRWACLLVSQWVDLRVCPWRSLSIGQNVSLLLMLGLFLRMKTCRGTNQKTASWVWLAWSVQFSRPKLILVTSSPYLTGR